MGGHDFVPFLRQYSNISKVTSPFPLSSEIIRKIENNGTFTEEICLFLLISSHYKCCCIHLRQNHISQPPRSCFFTVSKVLYFQMEPGSDE